MFVDRDTASYRRILRFEREVMVTEGLRPYQADRVMGRALARVLKDPRLRNRDGELLASSVHLRERLREEVLAERQREGLGGPQGAVRENRSIQDEK